MQTPSADYRRKCPPTELGYILKEDKDPSDVHKIGWTAGTLEDRARKCPGQSTHAKFEPVSGFSTYWGIRAETLIHAALDERGFRVFPGTRKEKFYGTVDLKTELWLGACEQADAEYVSSGRAELDALTRERMWSRVVAITSRNELWGALAAMTVNAAGKVVSVRELVELAVTNAQLARRCEALGLTIVGRSRKAISLQVAWKNLPGVVPFFNAKGLSAPDTFVNILSLSYTHA